MENPSNDPLAELKKTVISQKSAALPDQPPDPVLMPLHEVMSDYDRHVSQVVIGILGGSKSVQEYERRPQIDVLFNEVNPETHRNMISLYRRYQERLDHMMSLARQVASARST